MTVTSDRTKRILVIDDASSICQSLSYIFSEKGFEVHSCGNSDDALRACHEHSIGIAIVDIRLGEENGLNLIERFAGVQPAIRSIVHTAHASLGSAKNAVNIGAFAYVEKGDTQELVKQVHRAQEDLLQEALRESERQYRELVNDLGAIVWEAEIETWRTTFVSQQAGNILGFPVDDWLSDAECWTNRIHEDDRARALDYYQSCSLFGIDHEYDYRAITADGRIVWLHDVIHVVKDSAGKPVRLRGVTNDISSRKNNEEALRKSEERMSLAARAVTNGIWDLDLRTGSLWWNETYDRLFGKRPPETRDSLQWWIDHLHPEDRDRVVTSVESSLQGDDEIWMAAYRYQRTDGSYADVIDRGFIARDEGGKANRMVGAMQDVTDQRAAEREIRVSENHFRSLVEHAPICIHTLDLNGRLLSMNAGGLRMVDLDNESSVVGNRYIDFVAAADQPRISSHLDEAYGGKSCSFEFACIVNGEPKILSSVLTPLYDDSGVVAKLIGVSQDVTEQRRAEAELRAREEQFRQLAENIDAVFWMQSPDGKRAIYISPKYEQVWGRSAQSIYDTPASFLDAVVAADRPKVQAAYDALCQGRDAKECSVDYRIRRPDGQVRWIRDRGFSIRDAEGNILRQAGLAEDVTKERETLEALRESAQQYRSVVDASHAAIVGITTDGRVVTWNASAERMFGYSAAEIVGESILPLVPEDRRGETETLFAQLSEGRPVLEYETQRIAKDGRRLDVVLNICPIFNAFGKVTSTSANIRDVTEEKKRRVALHDSEQRLQLVLDATTDGVWDWNIKTGEVTFSPQWFRSLGFEPGELQPHISSWEQLVHPEDMPRLREVLKEHLASKSPVYEFVNRLRTKSGEYRWNRDRGRVVEWDQEGHPVRMVGTDSDISDRVNVELKLRESERRFRTIVDTTQEWIWETDVQGTLNFSNPAVESILGFAVHDVVGRSRFAKIHEDDRGIVEEKFRALVDSKKGWSSWVVRWRHRDGSIRFLESNAVVILDDKRRLVGYRGADRDVTDRLAAERQHREHQRSLAHVSRLSTMGEMVAGIAHEINQPLCAISNFAEACNRTLDTIEYESDSPIQSWLQQIAQQAVRCGDIIRGLRRFVEKNDDEWQAVDLNKVIRDSIALVDCSIRRQSIVIDCRMPQSNPHVYACEVELQQVLVNLLRNACDAVAEQEMPAIKISTVVENNHICLSVHDNGPGIDEQHRDRLFDPFYTTRPNGMGMGLAISKSIVEAHGGNLWLDRNSTWGATFHIDLPLAKPEKTVSQHAQ